MDYQQNFSRSRTLSNIPERKLHERILALVQSCPVCSKRGIEKIEQAYDGLCPRCSVLVIAYTRYHQSNIPFEFWDFDMKTYQGPKELSSLYESITGDLKRAYHSGIALCLAGSYGVGKTSLISCLLKRCCERNYSALYTTMTDLVNALIDAPRDERYMVQKELTMVDFLVCDELDSRFVGSEASSDLFGRNIEHIIRTRFQNRLPTLFVSNSPNPVETFSGALRQSIGSLMSRVRIIPVIGKDFRKVQL